MPRGLSTGPRTPQGKERSRLANWKHGLRSEAHIKGMRNFRLRIRAGGNFLELLEAYETYSAALDLIGVKVDARDDENLRELFAYVVSFRARTDWVRQGINAGGSAKLKKRSRWERRMQKWLEAGARGACSEELAEMLDDLTSRSSRPKPR